jgi:hypothetical protein
MHRQKVRYPANFRPVVVTAGKTRAPFTEITAYYDDIDGLLRDPTANALRAMDTNALPFLVAEFNRGDSAWAAGYRRFYWGLPLSLRKRAPSPPMPRESIRSDAALALAALGPAAIPAVPAIIEVFGTEPQLRRMPGLQESLRRLPRAPDAFDQVLQDLCRQRELMDAVQTVQDFHLISLEAARVLTNAVSSTNSAARTLAVRQFPRMRHHAALVLPALIAALGNSDTATRQSVATVLESFVAEAASALPALVSALRAEDGELRYLAARAIESMSTNAIPAVPALTAAINDTNVMVQRVAVRTLKNLESASSSREPPE